MKQKKNLYVTQPHLPPLKDFIPYLEKIWDTRILTNGGPFHQELEEKLAKYLGVEYVSLFTNGTIALVTALQELKVTGEVITTPFTFAATSHALLWNNVKPVFVDIDPESFNLDPDIIEAAITPQTTAILPVHVYGNPCEVEKIQKVADLHGLKVIYDAAHAFGVKYKNESVLKYGDLSILSFHATKVFNTFEGGAIICPDFKTKQSIDNLKNFGFSDEVTVMAPGINGKMNEVQAAMGLLQLKHIDGVIEARQIIDAQYRQALLGLTGICPLPLPSDTHHNYSYFPIMVGPDYPLSRDGLCKKLKDAGVLARRYFYPLTSSMSIYSALPSATKNNLPNAHFAANQILCLPIYPSISSDQVDYIVSLIATEAL